MASQNLKRVYVHSYDNSVISLSSKILSNDFHLIFPDKEKSYLDIYDYLKSKNCDLLIIDISSMPEELLKTSFFKWVSINKEKTLLLETEDKMQEYLDIINSYKLNCIKLPDEEKILKKVVGKLAKYEEQIEIFAIEPQNPCNKIIEKKFIGRAKGVKVVRNSIIGVAPTEMTILLQGESGTGKTMLAEIIHKLSDRKEEAFVAVNMAEIPEGLAESELFGTSKGAYTGAIEKHGYFAAANKGTFFLDEISELPFTVQSKLLRVLESGKFRKLGSVKEEKVDVRFICASNKNIKELVAEGKFRSDLYYRIADFTVEIPPLRERKGDVKILAEHFVGNDQKLTEEAKNRLEEYYWPGNVRELAKCIRRAKLISKGEEIGGNCIIF